MDSWIKYEEYDKMEYDILLKNGRVVENVYPNAGKFHIVNKTTHKGKSVLEQIPEEEVEFFRLAKNPVLGIN